MREKEEEAGGSGWDARNKKSEFLQRVSITIAKGDSRVLDCTYAPRLALAICHWQIAKLPPHQTWPLAQCATCALWPPLVTQKHTTQLGNGGHPSWGALLVVAAVAPSPKWGY